MSTETEITEAQDLIEEELIKFFDLYGDDGVAFLRFQVHYIAGCIADRLGLQNGRKE